MAPIRRSVLITAGGAVLAALAATTASAAGHPPAPSHPDAATPQVYCGAGQGTGLSVLTTDKALCSTAMKGEKAFHAAARHDPGAEKPVTVSVDGDPWKCRTRAGDPNPHVECVDQNDPSRSFTLNS